MGVYAGFDFRRTYVEQAALLDASTVNEKTLMAMATPLTTASSPALPVEKPRLEAVVRLSCGRGPNREAHRVPPTKK